MVIYCIIYFIMSYLFNIEHSGSINDHSSQTVVCTWLVSTGVGVNAAWLKVTVGPRRSLAAVWS